MADTLDQIFMNASLGATELTDGEHTLVTTDANTSYVIKDMTINNPSILSSDSHLELNGFNVSSATANATGSLIIPPSSTLKLKTGSTYPFQFLQDTVYGIENGGYPFYESSYRQKGTTSSTVIDSDFFSSVALVNYADTTSMIYQDLGTFQYFHTATSDNNSVQKLTYARSNGSTGTLRSVNYKGMAVHDDPTLGPTAMWSDGDYFYRSDLATSPTSLGSTSMGDTGYSPTSSYPRSMAAYGYFWWIINSAYTNRVLAMRISDGVVLNFDNVTAQNTAGSDNISLQVTLDPTDDRFIIWRPGNYSNMTVTKLSSTKTQLDALTSDTVFNGGSDYFYQNTFSLASSLRNNNSMSSSVYGSDENGNFTYIDNSAEYRVVDINNTAVGDPVSVVGTTVAGATLTTNIYMYQKKTKVLTTAGANALSIPQPTFGLQLLGIKSET